MSEREPCTSTPAGRSDLSVGCAAVTIAGLSALTRRAASAQPKVFAIDLDARLERIAQSRDLLAQATDEIVDLAVAEAGTPRRFAHREVASALDVLDAMPVLCEAIRPTPVPARSGRTLLEWMPYGVVLGWHAANSPVWVPTLVVASALVGGNSVLSRPSSRARATTARVLEALAAPWPKDAVVQVDLPGPRAEPLVWHDDVQAVVTHAGTATCKRQLAGLGRAYAKGARLRPYIPEASGNDAAIVLAGADLAAAAHAIAIAGFANGGQLCMAAKRIIVERAVWASFEPLLVDAVERLVVGPAHEMATDVPPMRDERARARLRAVLEEAVHRGGRVVVGRGEQGEYITPTVIALAPGAADVGLWREEVFGPVRAVMIAEDADHAVALANDSVFGLGAAIFGPAGHMPRALRAARIMLDEGPLYQDPHMVVGGIDDSGMAGARPKVEQLVYARRIHHGR
jgi:acyl-CoA reductase-like NAD-dependent aldehyde dehydrogenase